MIVEMKEISEQDRNRKLIKSLGYIPFHMSTWGKMDDEPEDPPATLYTICPKCFRSIEIKNKREPMTYEGDHSYFTMEGNKWGYQKNRGKSTRIPYTTNYIPCHGQIMFIDHNGQGTAAVFRLYEEVQSSTPTAREK